MRLFGSFRALRVVCASALTLGAFGIWGHAVCADDLPAVPVKPEETKVLILPVLDQTGDKPEMRRRNTSTGLHRTQYDLLGRGFVVLPSDTATRIARDEDIDLEDAEGRGKKSLKTLGKTAGADWVIALTVVDIRSENSRGFLGNGKRRARAKVQLKIYDVKAGEYLTNKTQEETKTTERLFGGIGTTGLFREALDTTVQRSLQSTLRPYTVVKKLPDEFEETDLVPGAGAATPSAPAAPPAAAPPPGSAPRRLAFPQGAGW